MPINDKFNKLERFIPFERVKREARSFFSISMQSSLFSRSLLRRFRRGTVVHHDGPYTVRQETAIRL